MSRYCKKLAGHGISNGTGVRAVACMSQQQVADALGISRARVAQIEYSAIKKIRAALKRELEAEGIDAAWKGKTA
jgi:transcriptional regulator with XRE-family HTH domain